MNTKTVWDSFKAESENVVEKVKELVHEGNVRRVIVKHEGRVVAEFPLTAGVVGVVLAPVLAAIGALVALMKDCTVEVERTRQQEPKDAKTPVGCRRRDHDSKYQRLTARRPRHRRADSSGLRFAPGPECPQGSRPRSSWASRHRQGGRCRADVKARVMALGRRHVTAVTGVLNS